MRNHKHTGREKEFFSLFYFLRAIGSSNIGLETTNEPGKVIWEQILNSWKLRTLKLILQAHMVENFFDG